MAAMALGRHRVHVHCEWVHGSGHFPVSIVIHMCKYLSLDSSIYPRPLSTNESAGPLTEHVGNALVLPTPEVALAIVMQLRMPIEWRCAYTDAVATAVTASHLQIRRLLLSPLSPFALSFSLSLTSSTCFHMESFLHSCR